LEDSLGRGWRFRDLSYPGTLKVKVPSKEHLGPQDLAPQDLAPQDADADATENCFAFLLADGLQILHAKFYS
jgi:hypothetical protein